MRVKGVRPSLERRYERLCYETGLGMLLLPLLGPPDLRLRKALRERRPERVIDVIYRPKSERASHYFQASLPFQLDEWI